MVVVIEKRMMCGHRAQVNDSDEGIFRVRFKQNFVVMVMAEPREGQLGRPVSRPQYGPIGQQVFDPEDFARWHLFYPIRFLGCAEDQHR